LYFRHPAQYRNLVAFPFVGQDKQEKFLVAKLLDADPGQAVTGGADDQVQRPGRVQNFNERLRVSPNLCGGNACIQENFPIFQSTKIKADRTRINSNNS
jgi:hypothetical protein